jgi:16S rRNA (adenine1518-N6/adenine1519-N6)-dimethyltransferase
MHLRDVCKQYGITFKKRLGQNLLLDDNINRIMVEAAALTREDDVIEVGAGLGALTKRLVEQAGRVLAVEIDPRFMPCLEDQFRDTANLRLFRGDILNHSLPKLIEEFIAGGTSYKMVSNLPYYITTPVLFHFLESPLRFARVVVMVQAEVASRLASAPGSREYGVLTIAAQWHADVDIVHHVSRTCFRPIPNVDSCVVRFRCREHPLATEIDTRFLMSVVRAAFSSKRKTLRNSLTRTGALGAPKDSVLEALDAAGIDSGRRPEDVGIEEFARLAREIRTRIE